MLTGTRPSTNTNKLQNLEAYAVGYAPRTAQLAARWFVCSWLHRHIAEAPPPDAAAAAAAPTSFKLTLTEDVGFNYYASHRHTHTQNMPLIALRI